MMQNAILWDKDEQTVAKHLVLQYYLNGWLPILGSRHGRLLFIDGFAGPGEYSDGEPGSPLIALQCVRKQKGKGNLRGVEVVLLLIESDKNKAEHLENRLKQEQLLDGLPLPKVLPGTFDDNMSSLLDYIDEQKTALAPAFVMIDPFGVKGSRMKVIDRILKNDQSECMISFMYEPIRRFHEQPEFEPHLNELFGTKGWQKCFDMEEDARQRYLHDLFKRQLKKHGAKHVVFFELWNGSRHIYTIYFTTGHPKGCNLMKQAIWNADPSGSYKLRGYTRNQTLLFEPDTEPLARQLLDRFGDKPTPIEDIEAFVMSDETMFHTGHLRQKTLQRLEREDRVNVTRPQGGRGFANGKDILVQFK